MRFARENRRPSGGTLLIETPVRCPRGRTLTAILLDCRSDYVRGVWFNQPWMIKTLLPGQQVLFSGKPKFHQGRWEFSHPRVQWLEDEEDAPNGIILTHYRLTEGLKSHQLRRIIARAVEACANLIPEHLPESFRSRLGLPPLSEAVRNVHQPATIEEYNQAKRRILFDDLVEFQLGLALRRRVWRARCNAPVLTVTAKIDARIRRLFPFTFTDGQNQAAREIADDLKSGYAMHRLVQADVGAGKTVLAIYTMLTAVAHGWQAVLMAPTELLAAQHWQTIDELLSESQVVRALLTGSLKASERQRVLSGVVDGSIQLIVGTQAVIQEAVQFAKLGAVVIDEQHKFGVEQRASLSTSDETPPPHILVMTATPIPRTLCLTQFGDLDVTIVRDQPQGRQPVVTSRIATPAAKKKAWEFLLKQLRSGRQLYVVCPLVESSENADAASAEEIFRRLNGDALHGFRTGLVHGRMNREERNATMDRFRDHELDALVATTVIEVGVDVPNATLMLILDAERFGLSQLHQLRGRIARGKHRGYCFLVSDSDSQDAGARLSALERSSDGFEIAEQDFELRGPGDILGTRQHGMIPLRFANALKDDAILREAREEAFALVRSGEIDESDFAPLKRRVLDRFSQLMNLPRSG